MQQDGKLVDGQWSGAEWAPIFPVVAMPFVGMLKAKVKFLVLQFGTPSEEYLACLKANPNVVVVCTSNHQNRLGSQRALVHEMMTAGLNNPVVFAQMYKPQRQRGIPNGGRGRYERSDDGWTDRRRMAPE